MTEFVSEPLVFANGQDLYTAGFMYDDSPLWPDCLAIGGRREVHDEFKGGCREVADIWFEIPNN